MIENAKPGMVVWIKSAVEGKPQKAIVDSGDDEHGYRLTRMEGKCYKVRFPRKPSEMFSTKEEAQTEN